MTQETLGKLWTPLFTTKARGMGFGLPICKRIIDAHGGRINVQSTPEKGTTFTVAIPLIAKPHLKTTQTTEVAFVGSDSETIFSS
jgi:signal transduction histidine kinase